MKLRAVFLRFGISVQQASVVSAYEEFYSLWLQQFEQHRIPNVGTLCALVAAHQKLPSKGDVAEAWTQEAQKVLTQSEQTWHLPAHEFTETVHRLRCLGDSGCLRYVL